MFDEMDWLPILSLCTPVYTTLVWLFYCKAIFIGVRDMMKIKCSIRGVDIELNAEQICKVLGIEPIGEHVYHRKTWPHVRIHTGRSYATYMRS